MVIILKSKISKTEKCAISFFNNVQDFAEIVEQIKDDPKFGKLSKRAYGIRKSLAQKILKARESLPEKKFQSIDQLDSIRGIGKDTMHDIINTFETNSEPNHQPHSLVSLNDILAGITSALVKTKSRMDETSLEIGKEYSGNKIMSNLSVPFFSISEVSLNLRFAIQNPGSKNEDLFVSVDSEYLEKLPDYAVSQLNLKLSPKKTINTSLDNKLMK